jgi:hypothetical protein
MQKSYINKLNKIEKRMSVYSDNSVKILTYCTLPDKRIKARLEVGFDEIKAPVYFDTKEELEQYKQEQGVTFTIGDIDIDKN